MSSRRRFLQSAGVVLALPHLESLNIRAAQKETTPPMRMVCVGNEFGMYPGAFWPETFGRDYEITPLLKPLAEDRDDLTVFAHLDHGLKGGHFAVHTFLTGIKSADARFAADGGISLDQRAAEHVGSQTRFPSLTIGSEGGLHGGCQMSWTRAGTRVPPVPGPRELFRALFLNDSKSAKARAEDQISLRNSILDSVREDAQSLKRRLNQADGQKLEEYFSSVRDVETRLQLERQWQSVPKPKAPFDEPKNEGLTKDLPLIYDLIALALQTDSTRVSTLEIGGTFAARDLGIRQGYHSLSHHGKDPKSIEQLVQIELYQMEQLARFLQKLKGIKEPGADGSLLDRTMVLAGSGMGNANSHTNQDLPVILAGGGFEHGQYREFPSDPSRRIPLCNLFVSMLQRFGVETDRFGGSTGTLRGFEV